MNSPSPIPVDARNITKRFGEFVALKDLSLAVQSGQCVGLLGPNGAGKSTFIGCLHGSVDRSGGDLRVFGLDPARDARRITKITLRLDDLLDLARISQGKMELRKKVRAIFNAAEWRACRGSGCPAPGVPRRLGRAGT